MLSTLKSDNGIIKAAMEFQVVNTDGTLDPAGEYIFVNQLEKSSGEPFFPTVKKLIQDAAKRTPGTKYVYWERRDKFLQKLHIYKKSKLIEFSRR